MELFWSVFWTIVTVLFVAALVALWIIFGVRGSLVSRAERAKPEDAEALRDVQRQIDAGGIHSVQNGYGRPPV